MPGHTTGYWAVGTTDHKPGDMIIVAAAMEKEGSYWIVIDGKSWLPGILACPTRRIGPFVSEQEAEVALPDHLPWDTDTYVYSVRIEADEPNCDTTTPK